MEDNFRGPGKTQKCIVCVAAYFTDWTLCPGHPDETVLGEVKWD